MRATGTLPLPGGGETRATRTLKKKMFFPLACETAMCYTMRRFQETKAPVAQLDRVSDYESEGYRFDSCQARHF